MPVMNIQLQRDCFGASYQPGALVISCINKQAHRLLGLHLMRCVCINSDQLGPSGKHKLRTIGDINRVFPPAAKCTDSRPDPNSRALTVAVKLNISGVHINRKHKYYSIDFTDVELAGECPVLAQFVTALRVNYPDLLAEYGFIVTN